ncbi:SWIM zinc finger domain-containing protein [Leptolyngbya sp. PCC 6406]|uniref:SWIM zinc finger family protein n=1 Tax=Leptolyngbya sp. PCC 6406 TaxID=1173264 RepID=UPI0002ACD12C|nr:SWIM zinc finger family protein [Leptolyngbya sp. PCC 6406]
MIYNISLDEIHEYTEPQVFARGENYYQSGAVERLVQRGQTLEAMVLGSDPYRVQIDLNAEGITAAACTCPYDWGGWCKHIVATLLAVLDQPHQVEQRPELEALLADLSQEKLTTLLQNLVTHFPETLDWLERQLQIVTVVASGMSVSESTAIPPAPVLSIDPFPFRRAAQNVVRSAVEDWEYGGEEDNLTPELEELVQEALAFAHRGDGLNALVALEAIIAGVSAEWSQVCDYGGDSYDSLLMLDDALTEAILTVDWQGETDLPWQEKLEQWQDDLDVSLAMALEALRQQWHYPPLQRILQGQEETNTAMTSLPDWASTLARIRLRILARQKRYEEYLRLARGVGLGAEYLLMLTQLGRIDEVMAAAPEHLTNLRDAYALAQLLWVEDAKQEALAISKLGLSLPQTSVPYLENPSGTTYGNTHAQLIWISDLAMDLGDRETAITAQIGAFKDEPSLRGYEQIQSIAPQTWSHHRAELLDYLRQTEQWNAQGAKVNIFLHEGLLEDAIAVVSERFFYNDHLILQVMDAVMATHSDWVVATACSKAEGIMNGGKAKYYGQAVTWLKRAKAAYVARDRAADWQAYYQRLKTIHGRKYKLMDLMRQALD